MRILHWASAFGFGFIVFLSLLAGLLVSLKGLWDQQEDIKQYQQQVQNLAQSIRQYQQLRHAQVVAHIIHKTAPNHQQKINLDNPVIIDYMGFVKAITALDKLDKIQREALKKASKKQSYKARHALLLMLHSKAYKDLAARLEQHLKSAIKEHKSQSNLKINVLLHQQSQTVSLLVLVVFALCFYVLWLIWAINNYLLKPYGAEPQDVLRIAQFISLGQFNFVKPKGASGVYEALYSTAHCLALNKERETQRQWLQQGESLVGNALRQHTQLIELANALSQHLFSYLHNSPVLISVSTNHQSGVLLKPVCYFDQQLLLEKGPVIEVGKGALGQAAELDRVQLFYTNIDKALQLDIFEGYQQVLFVPCYHHNHLICSLVIAYRQSCPAEHMNLLQSIRATIANGIANINANQGLHYAIKAMQKQQKELKDKADLLEKNSHYKSEFLANMSHELRTPLNSLLILSKSLANNKNGNLSDDQVKAIQVINDSGQHLLTLINDILDLSKVEAGQLSLVSEKVLIKALLDKLQLRFLHMAQEKGLHFEINNQLNEQETWQTDALRLEQILTNLIANAIKFTPSGSVSLNCKKIQDEKLQFEVIDTGIGIQPEHQERIFLAFTQADGSMTRQYGGTGLGLAISSKLCHLLGGELDLRSDIGRGSCFSLRVPPYINDADPVLLPLKKAQFTQSIPAKNTHSTCNIRVLFIEEDMRFAMRLASSLRAQGVELVIAASVVKALGLAAQEANLDAALLNMSASFDAYTLIEQLGRYAMNKNLPCIALWDDATAEAGAPHALAINVYKSQSPEVLLRILNGAINKQVASC